MNPKRILVPVTLSDGSTAALAVATRLAPDLDASIVLLHVMRRAGPAAQKSHIERKMRQLAERWRIELQAELEIEVGRPVEVIIRKAAELQADAVVMSTHGYRGWFGWAHRHTARHVLRRVDCPVWLVSPWQQGEAVKLSVHMQSSPLNFSHPWQPAIPNSFPSLLLSFLPPGYHESPR